MTKDRLPLLAITLGDPAGIGPEVCLKALADPATAALARCLLVGPAAIARETADRLGIQVAVKPYEVEPGGGLTSQNPGLAPVPGHPSPAEPPGAISAAGWSAGERVPTIVGVGVRRGTTPSTRSAEPLSAAQAFGDAVPILDVGDTSADAIRSGALSAAAGRAGIAAVEAATRLAMEGAVDAIVTAPLNKEAIHLAGSPYPGHTEMLAALTGARRATMLLLTHSLRVVHVSVHVSLREAIERVRRENVTRAIDLALEAASELGIHAPRIAVAGLNPHAGEGGLFGSEDRDEIVPAVEAARSAGHRVTGPLPPDTVFLRASRGEFDFVVAMYHDQGHIAVKMFGLEGGVNVTLGLPIIRTSVDHGTAFDIAGQGIAQHASMLEAIRVAAQIVSVRRAKEGQSA